MCVGMYSTACIWRSEDNSQESVLFLHPGLNLGHPSGLLPNLMAVKIRFAFTCWAILRAHCLFKMYSLSVSYKIHCIFEYVYPYSVLSLILDIPHMSPSYFHVSEAEVSILVSGLFFLHVIFGIILKYPIPWFRESQWFKLFSSKSLPVLALWRILGYFLCGEAEATILNICMLVSRLLAPSVLFLHSGRAGDQI